jgi:putative ABC transport system permease protein
MHLRDLSRTTPGFDANNVVTFTLTVPGPIARDDATRVPFQKRLVDAVKAIGGVDAVAFANQLPLNGCCMGAAIYPDGRPVDVSTSQRTSLMAVSPDYFRVMRVPLRRGRVLTERDLSNTVIYAVLNEAAAKRYWGEQDPIGAHGRFGSATGDPFQVIGIVGDVRNDGLTSPTVPEIYISSVIPRFESMNFVVRSARPAESLLADVRSAVRDIDPQQPIHAIATMDEIVRRSMTLARAASFLTAFFAGAALLMATLGVYGLVSYMVRQRRVEIGTRMALGATGSGVLALVTGGGMKMAAFGVTAGALAAFAATVYISRVFRIDEVGSIPFLYSTSAVALVAFVASAVPGWRASRLSPLVAMRDESPSIWQAA